MVVLNALERCLNPKEDTTPYLFRWGFREPRSPSPQQQHRRNTESLPAHGIGFIRRLEVFDISNCGTLSPLTAFDSRRLGYAILSWRCVTNSQ